MLTTIPPLRLSSRTSGGMIEARPLDIVHAGQEWPVDKLRELGDLLVGGQIGLRLHLHHQCGCGHSYRRRSGIRRGASRLAVVASGRQSSAAFGRCRGRRQSVAELGCGSGGRCRHSRRRQLPMQRRWVLRSCPNIPPGPVHRYRQNGHGTRLSWAIRARTIVQYHDINSFRDLRWRAGNSISAH